MPGPHCYWSHLCWQHIAEGGRWKWYCLLLLPGPCLTPARSLRLSACLVSWPRKSFQVPHLTPSHSFLRCSVFLRCVFLCIGVWHQVSPPDTWDCTCQFIIWTRRVWCGAPLCCIAGCTHHYSADIKLIMHASYAHGMWMPSALVGSCKQSVSNKEMGSVSLRRKRSVQRVF